MPRHLNLKEETFLAEYLLDFDAGRAALAAGYRSKGMGKRLLTHYRIAEAIEQEAASRRERFRIDADHVTEELAKLAFANSQDFFPEEGQRLNLKRMDRDKTAAIEEIIIDERIDPKTKAITSRRTRLKLYDKQAALMGLAKHLGIMSDVHIHQHTFEKQLLQMTPQERAQMAREIIEEGRKLLPAYRAEQAKLELVVDNETDQEDSEETTPADDDAG